MCSKQDKTKIEAMVRKYRKKKYKALERQYRRKRAFEIMIHNALKGVPNDLGVTASVTFEATADQYTIANVKVWSPVRSEPINSTSVAVCMRTDEFDVAFGKDIALTRAVRKAARLLVGLE